MVLNDSFSKLFGSPASLRKANDSFNESFGDRTTVSPSTIFRTLQKEHDVIAAMLRLQPPTSSQYQNSLNELIILFERTEDNSTLGFQKLVLSVFLKISANILNSLGKRLFQPTLYKLAQLIANSIVADISTDVEAEQEMLKKWADRVVLESSIHLLEFPNFKLDVNFEIDNLIDELGLANARFQFVKSSIFECARTMASEMRVDIQIEPESKFSLKNIADEHFLRLLLWLTIRKKNFLTGDLLPTLFSTLPLTPAADDLITSPFSLLDMKLYLVSLSIVSSTTTEAGMTAKIVPCVASSLAITKYQKDCWKAVVDTSNGSSIPATALSRLRTSQLLDAVRLTTDGSEDVRVLFEAWKTCLQPSAADDQEVFEAVKTVTEAYRTKMNQILAYGPFYSTDPTAFNTSMATSSRRDMKLLFPLQFDYEFVDTTEAGHIGVVINSIEGYTSIATAAENEEPNQEEELQIEELSDDTFHSFSNESERLSSAETSQFFSPMKHNRDSMCPSAIALRIREESLSNSSHISTKSVVLTPTRQKSSTSSAGFIFGGTIQNSPLVSGTPSEKNSKNSDDSLIFGTPKKGELSIQHLQNVDVFSPKKAEDSEEDEDEEEDELEVALRESVQKFEKSQLLAKQSPQKTPMKIQDAQTETDDVLSSSGSSIISVKYTPKRTEKERENLKKKVLDLEKEAQEQEESGEESDLEDSEYPEEDVEDEEIDEETMEIMMQQIFEATVALFTETQMKKFGLEKTPTKDIDDEEMMRLAEKKLAKIKLDMKGNVIQRLEKLQIATDFPKVPLPQWNVKLATFGTPAGAPIGNAQNPVKSTTISENEHDKKKCLGCQPEEKQEAALRCLEKLALEWDAEGNDYLLNKNY